MNLSDHARAAVAATAELLAEPDRVAGALADADRPWAPAGLADGAPGIALLFAELSRQDPAHRATAHAWLGVAARSAAGAAPGTGLYDAVPALAFALPRAAATPADYRTARAHLHHQTTVLAERLARREQQRAAAGVEHTAVERYDLVSGLAGLGAVLLDHHPRAGTADSALHLVLRALVRLSEPIAELPGWWVAQSPDDCAPTSAERGHANLGLAHGLPGPLALLALCWRQGLRVPGQRTALSLWADWLLGQARQDRYGPWWPQSVDLTTIDQLPDHPQPPGDCERPGRPSWCYGSPGIARALQLAGLALDQPDWRECAEQAAAAAVHRALDTATGPAALTDAGLCHGWAGLLQCTWRTGRDSEQPENELTALLPRLTERLLDLATPAPFGFRPPLPRNGWTDDPAGFLTGAAGVALALHTVATDRVPFTTWDRALLLA
ncbi:lanthionine synthetase C family protein [Kitasatospora cheerisanensis]|uniref:Lanthionine synthetase n=1 Tax=Kitasatospora cheerisanensis KCTC 2395 TaxID=1348663 RepID=A0A066YQM8_9ACTN|nr:lanthionine synthetase C family protein [Kitasatospora cheerisanensis]KDN82284.1 hypothetical protein KCH_59930 [Kitasatospora cheerisanensis KCTC 2395]